MSEEEVKTVPESVLKKRKRSEEWVKNKKQQLEAAKVRNAQNRKLSFKRGRTLHQGIQGS
ncbi:hypothetical protein KI387_034732, partial [Taxus chinensis]